MNDFKYFAKRLCLNALCRLNNTFLNKCALTYSLGLRCAYDFVISHIYAKNLGKSLKKCYSQYSKVSIRGGLNSWTLEVMLIVRTRSERVLQNRHSTKFTLDPWILRNSK